MDDRIEVSILLDFYGELLTEKQRDIMNMYYNEDLSLSEMSELTSTSRQAIHDIIKRCHKLLLEYEDKLELMKKNISQKQKKDLILNKISSLESKISEESLFKVIEEIRYDIIENF